VAYLVGNGIIHEQLNYFNEDTTNPFYQMGEIIDDFEHNEILRKNLSSLLGYAIPSTSALNEYVTSFTFNIPSDYVVDNLDVIVVVVDENSEAKNSQHAHVMEDKACE